MAPYAIASVNEIDGQMSIGSIVAESKHISVIAQGTARSQPSRLRKEPDMATILHTAEEAVIDAPAPTVLAVLRDFDGLHREILPPAFSNLVVEEGGVGAGTVMSFDLTLGGRTQRATSRVEEPSRRRDRGTHRRARHGDDIHRFARMATAQRRGSRRGGNRPVGWRAFSNALRRRGCSARSTGTSLGASIRSPRRSNSAWTAEPMTA